MCTPKPSPASRLRSVLLGLLLLGLCLAVQPPPAEAIVCAPPDAVTNPILFTDWSGFFPLKLGEITLYDMPYPLGHADPVGWANPICCCVFDMIPPAIRLGYYGLRWKFWLPVGVVEVTRTPFCFPSLGGINLASTLSIVSGQGGPGDSGTGSHTYHAHYLNYPVFQVLRLFKAFTCPTSWDDWPSSANITISYLSEIDPTWNFDVLSLVTQNPEAILFANPVAQLTCAIDCGIQSFSPVNNATDGMFWCNGCWGSQYPYTGDQSTAERSAPTELIHRGAHLLAKLHRNTILWTPVGDNLPCPFTAPTGMMRKSMTMLQRIIPSPETVETIGMIDTIREMGQLIPIVGEDAAHILWKKQDCCMEFMPCVGPECLPFPICFP